MVSEMGRGLSQHEETSHNSPESGIDQDVSPLHVAMEHRRLVRMKEAESLGDVSTDLQDDLTRQVQRFVSEEIMQGSILHVFH